MTSIASKSCKAGGHARAKKLSEKNAAKSSGKLRLHAGQGQEGEELNEVLEQ
jgi:hypothetical protein